VLDARAFTVTSILTGEVNLVVINGRSYGEGDYLARTRAPGATPIRVAKIADGTVTLTSGDEHLTIPLRTKQLKSQADQ
jgi:hypothetical protein